MNELQLINKNGVFYADSRQVAEMIGKRHTDLLRDINKYVNVLTNAKLRSLDFFVKTTYTDGKGEIRPCFLITRKGCDMVANKMTGDKGILFTAEYVSKFEEMEKQLKQQEELSPMKQLDIMARQIKLMQQQQKELIELRAKTETNTSDIADMKKTLRSFKELQELNADNWRTHCIPVLNRIAEAKDFPLLGGFNKYQLARKELYKRVDIAGRCNLEKRLKNRRERAEKCGASKTEIKKIGKLDVIDSDKVLINIAIAELNKMAVQYGAVN